MKEIFSRNELLVGPDAMNKINQTGIILFGVGGVGSWCAESLIRSGAGRLTIVDPDCVSLSNINRQLPATVDTVGQPKVSVLKERLLTVNPQANITALQTAYTAETNDIFMLDTYDYIIDAIDSLEHKANLIINATRTTATLFSSMGAALKSDASRVRIAEFWKVQGCPLAAALRRRFKKNTAPAKEFICVFSDEVLENGSDISQHIMTNEARKSRINGSMVHITAIFGFMLAGLVIQDITGNSDSFKKAKSGRGSYR